MKPFTVEFDNFLYSCGLDVACIEDGDTEFIIVARNEKELPIVERLVCAIKTVSDGKIRPLKIGRFEVKLNKKFNSVYFGASYKIGDYYKISSLVPKLKESMHR